MAVISVSEIWDRREATFDEKARREYKRSWRVLTDNTQTGPVSVQLALPVRLFDLYRDADGTPDILGAFAKNLEIRQDQNDPFTWIATALYSSRTDQPQLGNPNVTQRVPELTWDFDQFQKPVEQDAVGNAYTNSSGEKLDPPVEIDDSRLTLTYVRPEATFIPTFALTYKDVVNSDIFLGFAPGTVKSRAPSARRHFETGIFYYDVTYIFHFRLEGWNRKLLDQGYYTLNPTGLPKLVLDSQTGQPLSAPVLLNGEGRPLANATTTLSAGIDNMQQQLQLSSNAGFPGDPATAEDGQYFVQVSDPIVLGANVEVMQVTGGVGSVTLAVKRGQNGTDKVAHAINSPVVMLPFYNVFQDYPEVPFAPLKIS